MTIFPTPTGNRGGVLIGNVAYVANTHGVDSLWALSNPIDPTSAVKIGNFPTTQNVVLMAEVELRLNTNVVAEGSQNLYYTNDRVDARIASKVTNFALKANSGTLVPTSKLPFTFNPTGTPTEQLLALAYDGTAYQVRSTFAVSTLSDRPAASGATVGHIYHILQERHRLRRHQRQARGERARGRLRGDPRAQRPPYCCPPAFRQHPQQRHPWRLLLPQRRECGAWRVRVLRGRDAWRGEGAHKRPSRRRACLLQEATTPGAWSGLGWKLTPLRLLNTPSRLSVVPTTSTSTSTDDTIKRLDRSTYVGPGQTANHYRWLAIGGDSGGGTGTDTNDYVDTAALALSGQDLTLTLERTGSLADVTATVTLPAAAAGSDDTKVVTALPDAADVADADKGKLWIVQSMANGGTEEVAHFSPTAAAVLEFTAQSYIEGTETVVGFNAHHGHAVPNDTNIESFYWDTVDNNTQLYFTAARTPFDFHSYPQLAIYLRRVFEDGDWQRLWMEETSGNSGVYNTQGAQTLQSIVAGNDYHLIIRHVSSQVLNQAVATVPSTNRLEMFPNGGRFRAFADLDSISHLSVVTEVNRVVDGEVDSVDLAVSDSDLTLTVGRSVGADLTSTVTLPTGLPLTGGTLTGNLSVAPGSGVAGPALTITKNDTGGTPVVRMIHPDNQTAQGQRPFNARRDGEADYFEVNGRLGGDNTKPGIGLGIGSGGRDVQLYRDGANILYTPDTFRAAILDVDSTGQSASRTNLGLGSAAILNSGDALGNLAVLATGGVWNVDKIPDLSATKITSDRFATARLGTGTASSTTVLHGDRVWRAVAGGDSFDLHDDVTQSATIADADRLVFADEQSSGDPMRYTTATNLADYVQNKVYARLG